MLGNANSIQGTSGSSGTGKVDANPDVNELPKSTPAEADCLRRAGLVEGVNCVKTEDGTYALGTQEQVQAYMNGTESGAFMNRVKLVGDNSLIVRDVSERRSYEVSMTEAGLTGLTISSEGQYRRIPGGTLVMQPDGEVKVNVNGHLQTLSEVMVPTGTPTTPSSAPATTPASATSSDPASTPAPSASTQSSGDSSSGASSDSLESFHKRLRDLDAEYKSTRNPRKKARILAELNRLIWASNLYAKSVKAVAESIA